MISFPASKYFFLCTALILCAGCSSSTSSPASSGPGGTIYFDETGLGIETLDLSSGNAKFLTGTYMPYFRSDNWILCVGHDLEFVSPDGSQRQVILAENSLGADYDHAFLNPRLSPDGKYVAFYQVNENMTYVVSASTGALVLTVGGFKFNHYYTHPTWGNDGSLFVQGETFGGAMPTGGIYKIDNAFTTMVRIDPNLNIPTEPRVSPDGTSIAFILNNHLWTMGIDGTNPKQRTNTSSYELEPVWSPDGKWIAVNSAPCDLLLVPLNGGDIVDFGAKHPASPCITGDEQMAWK